jgi:Domain of unknown function (DUF927)
MLSRTEFLSLVLPPLQEGEQYCSWGNSAVEKNSIEQKFVGSIEELSAEADRLVSENFNSFFALAKFTSADQGRYATNAVALKSFFLDVDCGEGKPYTDISAGLTALKSFCKATGLPKPMVVKSGRGAHVYWVLDKEIPRAEWKPFAERLKQLCVEHDFNADPSVTTDAARILRVPDTLHLKDFKNPIQVEVLMTAPVVALDDIAGILTPTEEILKALDKAEFKRPMDATTLALMGSSQARFKTIMMKSLQGEGCQQLANIYENQADLEEPLWRAGLSIAQHCVDRDSGIHNLSKKHPEYSPEETDRKANETKGPYTCETFKKLNPSACEGCTLKITSPIQLGKEIIEATEEDNTVMDIEPITKELKTFTIPSYPFPYFRGKGGGIYVHRKSKEDDEEEDALVYPYDFYVVKRMQDPDHGETLLFRLHLPKDGVREFIMPLATVMAKDRFRDTIASHGLAVLGKKQDELMGYVTKWVEQLQLTTEAEKAHKQFGWIEGDGAIIIGDREIRATEIAYSPPSSPTLPIVPFFQPKGDFHVWKDVINSYGREGMENRAFAFFMGFGSLLMRFTNLDGFLLNLLSRESGSGKTTVLHAINSIYGRPKELLMSPKDTYNFRMQRFGTMQSLCATMDEITNMPAEQMSNQVYDITSGKGKNRMKQHENAERLNHSKWALGLVTSSNRSITDSLLSIKSFPEGELMRILEIQVKAEDADATWSKQHFGKLMSNYGHAIEPYAQALVSQLPMVIETMNKMQERVDKAADIKNTERYWSAMATIAITGGTIAQALGLHDIPVKPVFDYSINLIKETRNRNREYMFDNDEYLGGFLQRHFHEILVINGNRDARNGLEHGPIREPRGALVSRYEPDTKLLYVVVKSYRDDCAKNFMNFEESLAQYRKNSSLLGTKKKRMTAGTVANTQAPVNALCFDTTKLDFFNETVLLNAEDTESALINPVGEV